MGKRRPLLMICLFCTVSWACRGSAGKFCQESADCRPDLICHKAARGGFGVCDIPQSSGAVPADLAPSPDAAPDAQGELGPPTDGGGD